MSNVPQPRGRPNSCTFREDAPAHGGGRLTKDGFGGICGGGVPFVRRWKGRMGRMGDDGLADGVLRCGVDRMLGERCRVSDVAVFSAVCSR